MKISGVVAAGCAALGLLFGCGSEDDGLPGGGAGFNSVGGSGGTAPMAGSTGAAGAAGRAASAGSSAPPQAGSGGGAGTTSGPAGSGASGAGAGAGSGGAGGTTAAAGSGGSAAPAACSGKPGMKRGKSDQTLMAGGAARTFVYYAPASLDANVAVPLVIVPHGFTMTGQQMFDITGYDKIADREGFVVAYPDGIGAPGPWNVGQGVCGAGASVTAATNDQALIDELIKFAEADQCIDRKHVFVTGFSMGGYFSNETGCLRSEIKAVGPHSGGSHDLSACPAPPKPVIIFHGDADWLITYSCGTEARDRWAAKNGCGTGVEMRMVKNGTCEYAMGCPAGAQVALCTFSGLSHGWAGGAEGQSYSYPDFESASELGWKFFKEFAW